MEKRRQLDGENGGEDQKTTDRHPDREDLAQEENAAKQPEHGLEPEQESGMAGQGELLRAVLDQEASERRKKGGEADLDEPSGALPYEGIMGDEPRQCRQGSGHQELYEGEHDGVPTGGVVPDGDDLSREHERRDDGQDLSEVHRPGEIRRQEPHADETDEGRRQGEPAGEKPSQAPQEQGDEDHVTRDEECLSARRGVVQAEGLEPHTQKEEQADDGAPEEVPAGGSAYAWGEEKQHQERSASKSQEEQPPRGVDGEPGLHGDEAESP